MSRHRGFTFTINNWTEDDINNVNTLDCKYIVYGREICPTTGTPHLQGYVYFANAKTFNAVRKLIRGHIIIAKGTAEQNYDYCSKEGRYVERGDRPLSDKAKGEAERVRWAEARRSAMEGRFCDIPDDLYTRYQNSYKRMRKEDLIPPEDLDTSDYYGIWIWGPPGTGKSHMARNQFQPLYLKDINKWWDGYDGQDNVLIDEFSPDDSRYLTGYMKKWVDKWKFSAECKGGRNVIRPKMIIVTSNYSIEDCFPPGVDRDAMTRRFKVIHKTERNGESPSTQEIQSAQAQDESVSFSG